jgi:hypothetical protein
MSVLFWCDIVVLGENFKKLAFGLIGFGAGIVDQGYGLRL